MSIRFAKQLIYGAFYVILWVVVLGGGFWLFFRSTTPPAQPTPVIQPISVLATNVFDTSAGHDTFLGKIANTNTGFAAQYFNFSFDLVDASGTVLQSLPGASFLYGSEVKYITLVNEPVTGEAASGGAAAATTTPESASWVLNIPTSTAQWVATSSFGPAPQLMVENVVTTISSSSSRTAGIALAAGELLDSDTATLNNIFIVAVFKDANGNPIAASQTELDSIAPGQTENFSVSYPAVPGINLAETEVEAYAER